MYNDLETILAPYNPKIITTGFRMMCPFRENHSIMNDGSTSFFINPSKSAYHCFSCREHGNLITLLVQRFNIGLFQAYDLVGVENVLNALEYGTEGKAKRKSAVALTDVIIPFDNPPAEFIQRGFSPRVLKAFMVGQGDVIYKDKKVENVILTPIFDLAGSSIVNVKHRKGRSFWYVPESFDKENYLYNYHRCVANDWCVVVEGETDTYRSCQNGVWNTCSILGGELSATQARLLSVFKEVKTAFDNDSAGYKKTEYAAALLEPLGVNHTVVLYEGDDPGKVTDSTAWRSAIKSSMPYAEYTLRMALDVGEEYMSMKNEIRKHG